MSICNMFEKHVQRIALGLDNIQEGLLIFAGFAVAFGILIAVQVLAFTNLGVILGSFITVGLNLLIITYMTGVTKELELNKGRR